MDEDVKTPSVENAGEQTPSEASQPAEQAQTPEVSSMEQTPVQDFQPKGDLNVALKKEREQRRELQRKLAEYENRSKMGEYDPNDLQDITSHPFVQELMIKQAKQELTDYARERLDNFPSIPEIAKKAILKNVRGFVKETTSDVETAKLDIDEYLEEIAAETEQTQAPVEQPKKGFPVAATNTPADSVTGNSAEVERLLNMPVDELSADDMALLKEYQKSHK